MPSVEFNLNAHSHWDDAAKVWVGYIPALRLCAQARSEDRLDQALKQTVHSFIGLCWERGILEDAMRERGMIKTDADCMEKAKASRGQYIMIMGNVEREAWNEVPIALLAGKQAMIECQH